MIEHTVEITVDRSPAEVFGFMTDAANHPRWDTSSVSMQPEEPGPWREGMTFHEVRKIGPRSMEIQSRVATLVPGERMDIDSVTGPEFHGHWRFMPHGSGTTLRWSCEMAVDGPARLFQPLIARSFKNAAADNFARLKQLLEAGG